MPEPYWEVMTFWQAKAKAAEGSTFLVTNIGAAASGITASILTAFAGVTLDSLKPELSNLIGRNIGLADNFKAEGVDIVDTVLERQLKDDYLFLIDAIKAGIGQGVGSIHASLYETITGTNALLQGYNGSISRIGLEPYINRWANRRFTPNIPNDESTWFLSRLGAFSGEQFAEYEAENGWGTEWLTKLELMFLKQPPIPALLDMKRRGMLSDADLSWALKYYRFSDDMVSRTMALSVQYPEPYRAAEMHSKGLTTWEEYYAVTRIYGLPDNWAFNWFEAQKRYPDFGTAMALLRRGDITADTFQYFMLREQIDPAESETMLKLKDVIPPIQDLIRFAVREAYGDHDPEKQYPAMVEWASKMGLTAQASEWYWYAHWERIPVNLMYANYHRGLWDVKKLERMLKIVDVHPDDRQDIINVAYGPPSIREMGYGYDVGAYTLEDIIKYRRWGGLSPEDADKAGTAMVAYRTEAERNAVRMEYMYAFSRGELTEDELQSYLADIGTAKEAVPLWILRAKLYAQRVLKPTTDMEGKLISGVEAVSAFKLGLRDEDWLRATLTDLNWTEERIGVTIARAKLEMEKTAEKDAEVKYRKMTLAQLREMFNLKILSKEQMVTEIILIGYSAEDADLLAEIYTQPTVAVVKPKVFTTTVAESFYNLMMYDEEDLYDHYLDEGWDEPQSAMLTMLSLLKHEYPLLRTQYEKGTISGEQMVKELMKLEMPEINARALVMETYRELQIARISHEKDLTKAEIIKGVKNGVITVSQGAELLQGTGYDENEAYYILAINKVVEAGDPEGYWDMRRVVELAKKARGEKSIEVPDELIFLEREIKKTEAELKKQKEAGMTEVLLGQYTVKIGELKQRMKQLLISSKL